MQPVVAMSLWALFVIQDHALQDLLSAFVANQSLSQPTHKHTRPPPKPRLATLREREKAKVAAMKAKNELESTVYSMYDKLEEDLVDKVATPEEVSV